MPKTRILKPFIFKEEALYDAEIKFNLPLRLALLGLFTCCDKEGRFEWRPRLLKTHILPYDKVDFSRLLHALVHAGYLQKYASDNRYYGRVIDWRMYQYYCRREASSYLPNPFYAHHVSALRYTNGSIPAECLFEEV